ncbi:hypothetical protein [Caballeronia grimmiae]|uniref:Uncharacterized protein n=1 Tax=Caballeronia grimmiae TaxID=1071679 RepID=A0ABQ1S339_9BURK|nr:hypothetical protein [Caballeronia grimmiae]GGD89553.1 hypothetical protein GCM10010985_50250 [Caballeronia grimmiae]
MTTAYLMQWSKEFTGRLLPGACNARTRGVVRLEPAHEIDILKADFLAFSYHVAQFVYQIYRGSQVHRRRVGIYPRRRAGRRDQPRGGPGPGAGTTTPFAKIADYSVMLKEQNACSA